MNHFLFKMWDSNPVSGEARLSHFHKSFPRQNPGFELSIGWSPLYVLSILALKGVLWNWEEFTFYPNDWTEIGLWKVHMAVLKHQRSPWVIHSNKEFMYFLIHYFFFFYREKNMTVDVQMFGVVELFCTLYLWWVIIYRKHSETQVLRQKINPIRIQFFFF